MSWAAVLLAMSLLVGPAGSRARLQPAGPPPRHRRAGRDASDPLDAAASLDLLGACLRSGMAVSAAAAAVAVTAPAPMAVMLRRASDLLALGADPVRAWATSAGAVDQHLEAFARMARRSAASGAALARGVEELAEQLRDSAADAAGARAERASVLIAGPLGLCYLPAFLCLGIVPVVADLAGDILRSGVL